MTIRDGTQGPCNMDHSMESLTRNLAGGTLKRIVEDGDGPLDASTFESAAKLLPDAHDECCDVEDIETRRGLDYDPDATPGNKGRGNWDSKLEYFLSTLGAAVGLGNVWRFPYLCYRNGGGAFLVPYFLMLAVLGIPLMFLELSLGQFTSNGPLTCWEFAPLFRGIGIGRVIACMFTALNYNMVIGWSIYYFFASFTTQLPWENCGNTWNTEHCSAGYLTRDACVTDHNGTLHDNGTCYSGTEYVGIYDARLYKNRTGHKVEMPAQEYYENEFLHVSSGIDDMGTPLWTLSLCLLLAWLMVFFTLVKGVKSAGKVAYVTALFPYLVLLILLIRGCMLPNAIEGIMFYIRPEWSRLKDIRVWYDAALQIFYSLAVGGGGIITLASYNPYKNNVQLDTLSVGLMNSCSSIFAGFVVFSYLGYMAGQLDVPVQEVANEGAGFAFIIYPGAVALMPVSPLWSLLFFGMLISLGISSEVIDIENLTTALVDMWPHQLRKYKYLVTMAICVVGFSAGLALCTPGGVYVVSLLDTYGGGWTCFIVGVLEMISIAWIYGYDRFARDIKTMTGNAPFLYWKIAWKYLAPVVTVVILVFSWADFSLLRYDDYYFPDWANGVGFLLCLSSSGSILLYAVYLIVCENGSFKDRIRTLCSPTIFWGPAKISDRQSIMDAGYAPGFVVNPWYDSELELHNQA